MFESSRTEVAGPVVDSVLNRPKEMKQVRAIDAVIIIITYIRRPTCTLMTEAYIDATPPRRTASDAVMATARANPVEGVVQ